MRPLEPDDPPTIGAYRLLRRLGVGGMGRVYLARSESGRTVAVKVVHPHFAVDELFRERFRREVAAARRVGGQWTAPVLDAGPDEHLPWVATGYVAGPPLQRAIAEHGPLPERTVRALGAGLAEALRHVHGLGLVHRDVKPSNVLLTPDGPRLIDFGIARATEGSASLTSSGVSIGSPGYMSPEQVLGQSVSHASDVFSLGAVLAYAARGKEPFTGDSSATLLYKVVHEEPELDGIADGLRDVVAACLAKRPADRPDPAVVARTLAGSEGGAGALVRTGWLPWPIVEQIGRSAVELLSLEPEAGPEAGPQAGPEAGPQAGAGAGPQTGAEVGPQPVHHAGPEVAGGKVSGPVPFTTPAEGPWAAQVAGVFGPPDPSFASPAANSPSREDAPAPAPTGTPTPTGTPAPTGTPTPTPTPTRPRGSRVRPRLSCTLVVSVACLVAAALTGSYLFGYLPGLPGTGRDDRESATEPAPHRSSPGPTAPGSPGGGGVGGDVPRAFLGRWAGSQTFTDSGADAGKLRLTLRQGRTGERVGHGAATLAPFPPCGAEVYLKSASPRKLVVRSDVTDNSSLCTGGTEEYTLMTDGTLRHVTKFDGGNAKGTLHRAD